MLSVCCLASPLTVYTEVDLGGTEQVLSLTYTVYSTPVLSWLDNNIESFYLDEGYMVIVADQPEGLGPSKTYIAVDGDLVVNSLPANLSNTISFIRIIPWKDTLKKGKCGWLDNPSLGESWYYHWGSDVDRGQDPDPPFGEYVPMSWGKTGTDPESIDGHLDMDQVTHLLGFNEPDRCDAQSGQWWDLCQVPVAIGYYEKLQKSGLRLGSPGCHEEGAGAEGRWLTDFVDGCEAADIRVDFIALHWYDWGSNPSANPDDPASVIFNRFKRYLSNAYHQYRRPLWITEWNANPNRDTATQNAFLQLALPYLETLGYVERYSYFQPSGGTGDFFIDGDLTSTGQIYNDHISTPAYTSGILPAPWQHQDVGAVAKTGDAIYANGTYTVCGTGADIWGTADEFQFVYQPLTGDGEIIARVNSMVQRDVWTKSGVMIRETLDAGSKHATMVISAASGASFQYRTATNGTTSSTTQAGILDPYWVKLVRQGNTLTGYYSPDGSAWTPQGSQSISMNATVYAGLAVTSHNDGLFCDTTFTDVSVSWNGVTPPAAPTGLAASADSSVLLDWDDGEPDLTYTVYRSETSGEPYTPIATDIETNAYIDDSPELAYDTPYYYVVTAVDTADNESGDSNEEVIILYEGDLTFDGTVDTDDLAELGLGWLNPYDMTTFQKLASDWLKTQP